MRYIVFWIVWKIIETPCPDQWAYDVRHGQGVASCLVFHGQYVGINHNAGFNDRLTAVTFYKQKLRQHQENYISTSNEKGEQYMSFMRFNGSVDSVRIDSVKVEKR